MRTLDERWVKVLAEGDINEVNLPAHWAFRYVLSTHLSQTDNKLKSRWDQITIQKFDDLVRTT